MRTESPDEIGRPVRPFISRNGQISLLRRIHARRKHALLLGASGVGKTLLVNHLKGQLDLLVCPESEHLGSVCRSLEIELGLDTGQLKLVERKNRLLGALATAKRTVVFDGVVWTTPKLSSFLEMVMKRVPTWICARSDYSWDIGHFWTLLVRFEKVELHPFHLAETRELVAAAAEAKQIPSQTRGIAEWLHRRSKGIPRVLDELFEELAKNSYDLSSVHSLRRLDLDRRIREVFPMLPSNAPGQTHD